MSLKLQNIKSLKINIHTFVVYALAHPVVYNLSQIHVQIFIQHGFTLAPQIAKNDMSKQQKAISICVIILGSSFILTSIFECTWEAPKTNNVSVPFFTPCLTLPCLALPCLAVPYLAWQCFALPSVLCLQNAHFR